MSDKGDLSAVTIYKRLLNNQFKPFLSFKEKSRERNGGKLSIKGGMVENGLLKIQLEKYEIDLENINIKEKYREQIRELIEDNSLALIEFIGFDLDYDGKRPVISTKFVRNFDKVIDSNIIVKGNFKEGQKIFVKYIDVFGKENYSIYQINKGRMTYV